MDSVLRVKNTSVVENDEGDEHVVAKTASSVYTFFDDETTVTVCSIRIDDAWDKNGVVDIVRNLVHNPRALKCRDTCFVFESRIDLGDGGPELLHWLLIKNARDDVLFNEYEPELHDALVIHFDEINDVSITTHVFVGGRVVHMCVPSCREEVPVHGSSGILTEARKRPTIQDAMDEASLVDRILETVVNDKNKKTKR